MILNLPQIVLPKIAAERDLPGLGFQAGLRNSLVDRGKLSRGKWLALTTRNQLKLYLDVKRIGWSAFQRVLGVWEGLGKAQNSSHLRPSSLVLIFGWRLSGIYALN